MEQNILEKSVLEKSVPEENIPENLPGEKNSGEYLTELLKKYKTAKKVYKKTGVDPRTGRKLLLLYNGCENIYFLKKKLGIKPDNFFAALKLYNELGSYAKVGRQMGFSRQRIHQLIGKVEGVKRRKISYESIYEDYCSLVNKIGKHPPASMIPVRLYQAIYKYYGGIEEFRQQYNIPFRESKRKGRREEQERKQKQCA